MQNDDCTRSVETFSHPDDPSNAGAATNPVPPRWRILILGGGFGGMHAARRLGRTLGRRQDIEVALLSRENYLLCRTQQWTLVRIEQPDTQPETAIRSP